MSAKISYEKILASVLLSSIFFGLFYFFWEYKITTQKKINNSKQEIQQLKQKLQSQQQELQDTITSYQNAIDELIIESKNWQTKFQKKKDDFDNIEKQIKNVFGTVETISKIQKTDKELLAKYSKTYFLNEHYFPTKLANISKEFIYNNKTLQFHADIINHLNEMLEDAKDDDINLKIISAYRSFQYQKNLKQRNIALYGKINADKLVANQGLSEHQLGTAVDFINAKTGHMVGFENTDAYKWLQENAYKYGFVISYTKENPYYSFEPWHWRFVGKKLAKKLHRDNMFFYEMDQRKIYDYLEYFFD